MRGIGLEGVTCRVVESLVTLHFPLEAVAGAGDIDHTLFLLRLNVRTVFALTVDRSLW
ncbi:hypothetical protein [uncultured Muribaculum sp.]|uniref:hypothetical protein n=1 Tax=uncultured Muribaculum sp. TaxID=1918613 RepID=UPI0025B62F8A|nr:hypothetical protein [uncultured Muribaculum sp.]